MNNTMLYILLFDLGGLNTETEREERQREAWGGKTVREIEQ